MRRKDSHCPPAGSECLQKPFATTAGVASEAIWLLSAVPPPSSGRVSARHVSLRDKSVQLSSLVVSQAFTAVTEPQNGSVARNLWRSAGPTSLLEQGPPEHAA